MYVFAYALQIVALLAAICGGSLALLQLWQNRDAALRVIERAHLVISAALLLASAMLLHALYWHDFSVQYVANYTDRILHVFYRLTAFWAGQPGSMLFWALAVALSGSTFFCTRAYRSLSTGTRLWYWSFFYTIMAFFAMILTSWSNPFVLQSPVPMDGNGLNPLLQNPGMIFHPPLLFMGYGGFAVPSCLALAQMLSGRTNGEEAWFRLARPFIMLAWIFLTAGIVLGAWWAYMELGWGGYWAWDPVENASLIPWLVATAALHTIVIENRRKKLARVNVAMMALTTVTTFFATYLVRSGIIDSVHAFGDGNVGNPLIIFILASLAVSLWVPMTAARQGKAMEGLDSREGFLLVVAWIFLALAAIILVATMWPVISKLWSAAPRGLDARFYNKVCLPLGVLLTAMMVICPWLAWKGGIQGKKRFAAVALAFVGTAALVWSMGYRQPLALVATAAAIAILLGNVLLLVDGATRRQPAILGALGTHAGLALMALGIAFSGPYKEESDMSLLQGESDKVGSYTATLLELAEGRRPGYDYIAARLQISQNGKVLGIVAPERRLYDKFGNMQFSEVDVIPSLGNEIYASLLGLDTSRHVVVKVSVEPLVNWLWIGGTIMCLAPLIGLRRRKTPALQTGEDKSGSTA
jgi:cytochrome c-type biogenesis protein CcmF